MGVEPPSERDERGDENLRVERGIGGEATEHRTLTTQEGRVQRVHRERSGCAHLAPTVRGDEVDHGARARS